MVFHMCIEILWEMCQLLRCVWLIDVYCIRTRYCLYGEKCVWGEVYCPKKSMHTHDARLDTHSSHTHALLSPPLPSLLYPPLPSLSTLLSPFQRYPCIFAWHFVKWACLWTKTLRSLNYIFYSFILRPNYYFFSPHHYDYSEFVYFSRLNKKLNDTLWRAHANVLDAVSVWTCVRDGDVEEFFTLSLFDASQAAFFAYKFVNDTHPNDNSDTNGDTLMTTFPIVEYRCLDV